MVVEVSFGSQWHRHPVRMHGNDDRVKFGPIVGLGSIAEVGPAQPRGGGGVVNGGKMAPKCGDSCSSGSDAAKRLRLADCIVLLFTSLGANHKVVDKDLLSAIDKWSVVHRSISYLPLSESLFYTYHLIQPSSYHFNPQL
eukprot:g48361.t1